MFYALNFPSADSFILSGRFDPTAESIVGWPVSPCALCFELLVDLGIPDAATTPGLRVPSLAPGLCRHFN